MVILHMFLDSKLLVFLDWLVDPSDWFEQLTNHILQSENMILKDGSGI